MQWSGERDIREHLDWQAKLGDKHSFHEIYQPMATHDSGLARSRLDRIYSNQHVSDQLDAKYGCAALDWVQHLSHHRPVTFFRFKEKKSDRKMDIKEDIIKKEEWGFRVAQEFGDLHRHDPHGDDPIRRLFLLKVAIR